MKLINIFAFVIWILSAVFVIASLVQKELFSSIISIFVLALTTFVLYYKHLQEKTLEGISKKIDGVNLDQIENKLRDIEEKQKEYAVKVFKVEMDLENYKIGQENKYRDIVKKVLNMDNKLNEKFNLLGKTILKINKKIEEKD